MHVRLWLRGRIREGGWETEERKRDLRTVQREKFQQLNKGPHLLLLISKACCSLTYMRGEDKGPVMKPQWVLTGQKLRRVIHSLSL